MVILGSKSPRRQELLKSMGIEFEIRTADVEEIYPEDLKGADISDYLAKLKAQPIKPTLKQGEILLTSDTVVWHKGESLAKASDREEAIDMLRKLSNSTHEVITSVCFTTLDQQKVVNQTTEVTFCELTEEMIVYYVDNYEPYDKAGAYGIQEWIGLVGVKEINGSYHNVVGMPTSLVYNTLKEFSS
ncbi:Maf family nucleotide pyrophosphatase [Maribacter sp. CXY002]|uniref:Maf family nucleotide pyrophosphatase n=1 Tax=Maribacter luteocoastalis TaxID=3407671 RepID=UPI003B67120E